MGLLILIVVFAICVIIGIPVAFALGVAAVSAFFYEGLPMMIAFQRIISGISIFSLMAIPFFIFAGELMFHGGIAIRLVRFASSAVGACGEDLVSLMFSHPCCSVAYRVLP
jgi:TRAP-type mannitol/chloroaromatic compound transport system permease large subunit